MARRQARFAQGSALGSRRVFGAGGEREAVRSSRRSPQQEEESFVPRTARRIRRHVAHQHVERRQEKYQERSKIRKVLVQR